MIKDQDIKDRLIEELRKNFLDISSACEDVGVSFEYYVKLLDCEYFQKGLESARQCRDDFALRKFKDALESGNVQAAVEYQKMLRQSDDKNEALVIRKKSMKYYIETAETKANVLRTFSDVFGESAKIAEKFYQAAMTEFGLLSPAQRKKEELKSSSTKMSVLFEQGKLNELDMIRGLLSKQLHDAESSEYPSERKNATDECIKLTQRMEDIEERRRREKEDDKTPLFDKLDAIIARTTPDKISELKERIMSKGIACS